MEYYLDVVSAYLRLFLLLRNDFLERNDFLDFLDFLRSFFCLLFLLSSNFFLALSLYDAICSSIGDLLEPKNGCFFSSFSVPFKPIIISEKVRFQPRVFLRLPELGEGLLSLFGI